MKIKSRSKQWIKISCIASLFICPIAGQSAGLGVITKPAVNLGDTSFYTSTYPFINMMHRAAAFVSDNGEGSPYQNKYGWLQNLPARASATTLVVFDLDEHYGYLRPGQYKVTSASKATLNIRDAPGLSNIVNGIKQATFTVKKEADGVYSASKGYQIALEVKNNTASVIPLINDIQLYHVDDAADLQAGKIFTRSFKDKIKHCKTIRPMLWLDANDSQVASFSELPTEAHRMWHVFDTSRVPYTVATKLMLEIGAETGKTPTFWVNMPVGNKTYFTVPNEKTNTFDLQETGSAELTPSTFINGEPIFLGVGSWQSYPKGLKPNTVYYAVSKGKTLQLSKTRNGPAIDFGAFSDASLYLPYLMSMRDPQVLFNDIFKAIYNTKHTISGKTYLASKLLDVKVELSNETWNSQFSQTQWLRNAGVYMIHANNYADPNAWISLKAWKAATNGGFSRNKVVRVLGGQVVYFENNGDGLNYIDSTGIIQKGTAIKDLVDQYAIAPYFGLQRLAGASLDDSIDNLIADGLHVASDEILMAYATRGIEGVAQDVATTKDKLAAINPAITLTTYEAGQHMVDYNGVENSSAADVEQFGTRMAAFLRNDEIAVTVHQLYLQKVFLDMELEEYNQFIADGGWYNKPASKGFGQWGMTRSSHTPDTPLMRWWKAL
jgi:hypothetical protein